MSRAEELREALLDAERALRQERALRREGEAVLASLQAISEAAGVAGLRERLFTQLRASLGCEHAALLESASAGEFTAIAATPGPLENARFHPGPLFARVLRGEPVAAFDVARVPEWRDQPSPVLEAVTSALHVPLGDGALLICSHSARGFFGKQHLELARRVAPLASQALLKIMFEQSVQERERFFTLSLDLMAILTLDGRFKQASKGWSELLGIPAGELEGTLLLDLIPHDERAAVRARWTASLPQSFESRVASQSGAHRWLLWNTVAYREDGLIYATARDVTALKTTELALRSRTQELDELTRQLHTAAVTDPLTGLFNRRQFERELERQCSLGPEHPGGALAVLDIDSFKHVNDTIGHHAGDELIQGVAEVLRSSVREADVLARIGGDEFAIILPGIDRHRAGEVADRLVRAVRDRRFAPEGRPLRVTISVGVTLIGHHGGSPVDMLVAADRAMYAAKEAGRDQYVLDSPALRQSRYRSAGLNWTERIERALAEDRFALYCQPIRDLATRRVRQYEILLRLIDECGQIVNPGAFLPAAERFGLIEEIDRWVTRRAIRMISELDRADRAHVKLEVNLSARSVGNDALSQMIEEEIASASVDPSRLVFEITETAVIANMQDARAFAQRLRRLGCRFALDDFGAGFGSFSYLKHLPLDYLKIDGDFIRSLPRSAVDQRMVAAMVGVAQTLGMRTIAEFVGDAATEAMLREFGVDFAQGYHVGRPMPAATLLTVPPSRQAA